MTATRRPGRAKRGRVVCLYSQEEKRRYGPPTASETNGIEKRPHIGPFSLFLEALPPLWAAF